MDGPIGIVAGLFGFGGPDGNDHGSSNWAAWGHPEIYSMLHESVDPGDIGETAAAWRDQGRNTADVLSGFTRDLNGIVAGGWRGASADAAVAALPPIDQWSASHAGAADHITRLMEDSGSAAGQAKASVPPPKSHNWVETLAVSTLTGPAGGIVDAVMQEQEQSEAHAQAVQIMNNVYSAPINDHRAAVPTYPQLADPTLQPSDQTPTAGPASGTLYSGTGVQSAGASGHVVGAPPAAASLQGVTSGGSISAPYPGGHVAPDTPITRPQHGGQIAAAAGTPVMAQAVGSGAAGRARAPGSGVPLGGGGAAGLAAGAGGRLSGAGHPSGAGHLSGAGRGAGHPASFGPRPSAGAAEVAESRTSGLGRGAGVPAAGRAGSAEMMAPMGAGRGKGGEDFEHRRPSYLIEMDDIFTDGRKVAPPVIGADPAGQGGSS
jgi:hypothetical protein